MHIEISTTVAAPTDLIWPVIIAVEHWPEWTASTSSVERLEPGPLRVGSSARVRQPGFPPVVWTVTEVVDGASFTWTSRTVGLRSVATHAVQQGADGSLVTLGIHQSGPLAGLARVLFGRRSRRFVQMEADGLRLRCESFAAAPETPPGATARSAQSCS